MFQAVLSNPSHPEYGVATIPFPIPRDQYAHCMELLEALEIGDAVKADCKVEKIDSFYTVFKRTEMLTVNVEELNYLAKRLDSFDTGEAAQFQAMAHKLELFELKNLINLTFCCQQATVITDFSDLAAIGRDHYMNLHGGSASVDELNKLDGEETARRLIENGSGKITPYLESAIRDDNAVGCSEAFLYPAGEVHTLFDQDHRIGAALFSFGHLFHNVGGVSVSAVDHFLVKPCEAFRRVLSLSAECPEQLVLAKGVGVSAFRSVVASFILV